ncbi:hypothetical protein [uncultured Reyranella sp.]|uniref:hypothetical protein n=1 Tax=uncultured Reyranella sp. TaxID=735512 RepID=UPI0025E0206B|nr:hypothetical protein [uncultured Reyranella sp.]
MMTITFAVLLAAFVFRISNLPRPAMACLVLSFVMVVGIFFWEIYSPEYGFRMPWLQVDLRHAAPAGST